LKFRRRARVFGALVAASFVCAGRAAAQDSTVAARLALTFQLHGFLQIYYRDGDPTVKDGFRLRKADLKFSGDLSPRLRWRITFDASKQLTLTKTVTAIDDSLALTDAAIDQRSRMVQDAALTYAIDKTMLLDIGQQIIPLSLEGTIPTAQVETIERTMFIVERSRATGLGDIRDIGVSANGRALGAVEYHIGVFNETGEGAGTVDLNQQKAVMGRIAIHPSVLPSIQFGGSGGFEGGPLKQRRERAGGEFQYRDTRLTLRTEAMGARDGNLRRFGWYGLGALRPTTHLQLVARFDSWDRDLGQELSLFDATENQATVGASYLLDASTKVAFNVIRQTFPHVANPRAGTILMAAFQAVW
jgi:hypothetical protein